MSGPIVIALDVIAYLALLTYIAHAWAVEAKRDREARAAWVAADVLARQKRQDAANDLAFEVRAAFLSQMTPEQQMRAELDRDDAVARIVGWGS